MTSSQPQRSSPHRRSEPPVDPALVEQEIERLAALDLAPLRVAFRNRTGRIAPAWISKPLLLRMLAYRIQAELFGDLRPDTRRLLDRIAAQGGQRAAGSTPVPAHTFDRPRIGTVLVREWQGRMEQVRVGDDGYAWNGSSYASLSAVAGAITGTKWNGRRFFGLDRPTPGRRP